MVSICKKKLQNKRQLSLLNKTLNDFTIGKDSNANAIEIESLKPQTSRIGDYFEGLTVGETMQVKIKSLKKNCQQI